MVFRQFEISSNHLPSLCKVPVCNCSYQNWGTQHTGSTFCVRYFATLHLSFIRSEKWTRKIKQVIFMSTGLLKTKSRVLDILNADLMKLSAYKNPDSWRSLAFFFSKDFQFCYLFFYLNCPDILELVNKWVPILLLLKYAKLL